MRAPARAATPARTIVPVGIVRTPRGHVLPAIAGSGTTWDVVTPCGNRAKVTAQRLASAPVVLDAGHGGSESGAVAPNGMLEKNLNLAVTRFAADRLAAAGVRTVLTRSTDTRTSLATRSLVAKGARSSAFVSIHHNAGSPRPSSHPGSEAWAQVDSPSSDRLAALVAAEVRAALQPFGTRWTSNAKSGARSRRAGDGSDYYGLLRRSRGVPAVISEGSFIDDETSAAILARRDVQRAEGEAIARAVLRFLAEKRASDPSRAVPAPSPVAGCTDPRL